MTTGGDLNPGHLVRAKRAGAGTDFPTCANAQRIWEELMRLKQRQKRGQPSSSECHVEIKSDIATGESSGRRPCLKKQ